MSPDPLKIHAFAFRSGFVRAILASEPLNWNRKASSLSVTQVFLSCLFIDTERLILSLPAL